MQIIINNTIYTNITKNCKKISSDLSINEKKITLYIIIMHLYKLFTHYYYTARRIISDWIHLVPGKIFLFIHLKSFINNPN